MASVSATAKRLRLRELLAGPDIVFVPSCGDAITSRLVESLDIPAIHGSGSSLHRQAGYPDAGILTMGEMAASLSLMANAVSIPVIGDADTGFGGLMNVARTVQEYERIGLAAMHLEDQLTPKRPPASGFTYDTITGRSSWTRSGSARRTYRRELRHHRSFGGQGGFQRGHRSSRRVPRGRRRRRVALGARPRRDRRGATGA